MILWDKLICYERALPSRTTKKSIYNKFNFEQARNTCKNSCSPQPPMIDLFHIWRYISLREFGTKNFHSKGENYEHRFAMGAQPSGIDQEDKKEQWDARDVVYKGLSAAFGYTGKVILGDAGSCWRDDLLWFPFLILTWVCLCTWRDNCSRTIRLQRGVDKDNYSAHNMVHTWYRAFPKQSTRWSLGSGVRKRWRVLCLVYKNFNPCKWLIALGRCGLYLS